MLGDPVRVAFALSLIVYPVEAQEEASSDERSWSLAVEADLYVLEDLQFVMPTFAADRGRLHLESRWNYEDLETLSVWAGWNLQAGPEEGVHLLVTPMVGGLTLSKYVHHGVPCAWFGRTPARLPWYRARGLPAFASA